jgi:hypothetical protein
MRWEYKHGRGIDKDFKGELMAYLKYMKVLSRHFPNETKESLMKIQSGYLASQPRFEVAALLMLQQITHYRRS